MRRSSCRNKVSGTHSYSNRRYTIALLNMCKVSCQGRSSPPRNSIQFSTLLDMDFSDLRNICGSVNAWQSGNGCCLGGFQNFWLLKAHRQVSVEPDESEFPLGEFTREVSFFEKKRGYAFQNASWSSRTSFSSTPPTTLTSSVPRDRTSCPDTSKPHPRISMSALALRP